MKITIHTERGSYTSKSQVVSADQAEQLKKVLEECATEGSYFSMETDTGFVMICKELLQTAAFVVDA